MNKPCPFCGGKARKTKNPYPHYVYCVKCGASSDAWKDMKDSIAAWNTRKPTNALVAALRIIAKIGGMNERDVALEALRAAGELEETK